MHFVSITPQTCARGNAIGSVTVVVVTNVVDKKLQNLEHINELLAQRIC